MIVLNRQTEYVFKFQNILRKQNWLKQSDWYAPSHCHKQQYDFGLQDILQQLSTSRNDQVWQPQNKFPVPWDL